MTHIQLLLLVVLSAPAAAQQDTVRRVPVKVTPATVQVHAADKWQLSYDQNQHQWQLAQAKAQDQLHANQQQWQLAYTDAQHKWQEQQHEATLAYADAQHQWQEKAASGAHSLYGTMPSATAQIWHQGDPADSLYRAASSLFNRTEYRSAADRFSIVRSRHPNTAYWCDASYYEAFARYRLGTPNDLRTANTTLEGMGTRCARANRDQDVASLRGRVDAALARLGDAGAADRIRRKASEGPMCDAEERNVKTAALSALASVDPEAAAPVLRQVLATRDECNAAVRRTAISIVAGRNDPQSVAMLAQIARNDNDRESQTAAVDALSRMTNEAAFRALEDLLRTTQLDERVQQQIASSMARSEHPRSQAVVRALIESRDVAERTRESAINSMASRNLPMEYWRSVYGKMESDRLRSAAISAVGRLNTEEAQQFLVGIARDQTQSPAAREAALTRVRSTAPIADLYRILETADSRSMRLQIVSGLSGRKEPEATDRLIDIATRGTDPEVRSAAIRALGQPPRKSDPKVIKALGDLITRSSI